MFYLSVVQSLEDEQLQKLGVVSISYQVGPLNKEYDYELTRKVSKLVKCMPLRFVAVYLCYSESRWKNVAELISRLLSPILKVRLRSIQGSHQECLYKLLSLGISDRAVPLTNEGEKLDQGHMAWLEYRRRLEGGLNIGTIGNSPTGTPLHNLIEDDEDME